MPGRVVYVADAPNWAAIRFGIEPRRLELRVLRDVLGCESVGVSYLRLGARVKITVGHRHPAGEEVYVLISGRAEAKVGDDVIPMEPVSALRVAARETRALRAIGDDGAVFIVTGSLDDPDQTELVPGFWPADGVDDVDVAAASG